MFSFRTTPLEDQLDRTLQEGRIGCFCTQNCWDTGRSRWMYDIFRLRGNLQTVFTPRDAELTPGTNHIDFDMERLQGLDAIVVEIQDVGVRYFNYTKDVMRLMEMLQLLGESAPSLYIGISSTISIPPAAWWRGRFRPSWVRCSSRRSRIGTDSPWANS